MVNIKKVNEQRIYSNYTKNLKFLGIIDYKSLMCIIVYVTFVLNIMRILPVSIETAVYLFIVLVIPVVAIFCVNLHNESTIDVIFIIFEFYIKRGVYVKINCLKDYKNEIYKC